MDGDGSISRDVSSGVADEVPLADPEPPQPNASPPPPGPTENEVALARLFAHHYGGLVLPRLPLRGPNMGHSAIFFESTRDGDDDNGDGGGDPRHGDVDADADAGAEDDDEDEDDAYGGFGFSFGAVPASGVAIACLPETTVGEGDGEGRERGECAVCLEEFEAGDALRTMPCAHGFHERCIFGWLRASRLCPLCRFALPPEAEGRDDDEGEARGG